MEEENKNTYDSLIIFNEPISLFDDLGNIKTIYGLTYCKESKHEDDLFNWQIRRFISFLLAASDFQNSGGRLEPDCWIKNGGEIVPLTQEFKNKLYNEYRERIEPYTIVEYKAPFETSEQMVEDGFLIAFDCTYTYPHINDTNTI